MLVVAGDGVGCPVGILVLCDHHGDLELCESFGGQADADVPSALGDISEFILLRDLQFNPTHDEWRMSQAICCWVTCSAAMIKSPSFSRSMSSTTTRNSPRLNAASASSTESRRTRSPFGVTSTVAGACVVEAIPSSWERGSD